MKITWSYVWAVGGMIELFPAKCRNESLCCSCSMCVGTTTQLSMPRRLFWIARRNFKCVLIDTCVDCGALRQEVHKHNTFSVPKHCAHDVLSRSSLLEFRLCWRWGVPPLLGLLLWFRDFVLHLRLVPCDYVGQEVFTFLTVLCQKVQCPGLPFNPCPSVSFFSKQCANNFRNLSLSDTISWRIDSEV